MHFLEWKCTTTFYRNSVHPFQSNRQVIDTPCGLWNIDIFHRKIAILVTMTFVIMKNSRGAQQGLKVLNFPTNKCTGLSFTTHPHMLCTMYCSPYGYCNKPCAGIILCMSPANERWCYIVMLSLIGWAHTQNDPCMYICWHKPSGLIY